MGNVAAIFGKEMRSYFGSPVAYVMAGVFLLFTGFVFRNQVLEFHDMSVFLKFAEYDQKSLLNVNKVVVESFFEFQTFIWMIVIPMLTMRLYAEEKRGGTYELLMTSPLTSGQILMGKFLACYALYLLIEIFALGYLGILSFYARIDWGPVFSGSLAILLLGGTFISVGILASSLTENQIVAAVLSFFMLILLWIVDWAARYAGDYLFVLLKFLSLVEHTRDMVHGVVDTHDVFFFLSATVFFLFVTYNVLESNRWRA
jgi:ABC-2 type transport system permease protein